MSTMVGAKRDGFVTMRGNFLCCEIEKYISNTLKRKK